MTASGKVGGSRHGRDNTGRAVKRLVPHPIDTAIDRLEQAATRRREDGVVGGEVVGEGVIVNGRFIPHLICTGRRHSPILSKIRRFDDAGTRFAGLSITIPLAGKSNAIVGKIGGNSQGVSTAAPWPVAVPYTRLHRFTLMDGHILDTRIGCRKNGEGTGGRTGKVIDFCGRQGVCNHLPTLAAIMGTVNVSRLPTLPVLHPCQYGTIHGKY